MGVIASGGLDRWLRLVYRGSFSASLGGLKGEVRVIALLQELKQTAEAQRQEIEKQKQESSRPFARTGKVGCGACCHRTRFRCIQDLQAQLASLAKEKQKADEETSRHTAALAVGLRS